MTSSDDTGATADAVSPPAGPSAAELSAVQEIADGAPGTATIRPGSRSRLAGRSRGDTARATGDAARAAVDEGDVGPDSEPSASPSATAVAEARSDRSTVGAANTPAAGGTALGRAAISADTEHGDAAAADTLADGGLAAGTGRESQDDGSGAMASESAAAPIPRPAPRPVALAGRSAGQAARPAAVSRGETHDASMPAGAATDGDETDGLSTEGMLDALAAIGPATAGGRRASAIASGAPALAVASLPRATANVLPVEGRVREIAAPFANRVREKRDEQKTDSMVDRGLDFLRRAQQSDGRWSLGSYPGAQDEAAPKLSSDTAATGLALLSFLGAGHDHFDGRHRDTVRRGLDFLLAIQKDDGDLYLPADPLSNSCAWLYSHGIATMSLCEAVGMTGDEIIRPAAERACRFIAASQHPDRGGWRYTPRSDADLSVSGWMLVALRSGQLAKVPVDPRTFDGVRLLLDASVVAPSSPAAKSPLARFHYNARKPEQRPAEMSTACMNALGTLMRLHTGLKKTDPQVVANGHALAAIRPTYGSAQQKLRDCYLWYYVSQVLVHTGGPEWDSWYASLDETLSAHQASTGQAAGSWDPLGPSPDRWGQYGGRIYVTALHLLTLEVPYRHLPTYSFDE